MSAAPVDLIRPHFCEIHTINPIEHTSPKPLIDIRGLHFKRGSRTIFNGIDVTIERGKITAIMGPSGTGKTTLLRMIAGQLAPTAGYVEVLGERIHQLKHADLYRLRQQMGMLFQSGALFTDMNVFDNVAFPLREHTKLPEELVRIVVLMKLESVGLRGAYQLMPGELSGGMARRVALARAIALDPMMVMYDEPFAGQDPISMGVLVKLIRKLNDALGLTSIIVSHDVKEVCSIADSIYLLAEGNIIAQGSPQQLNQSTSDWTAQFMQGLADGPVPFHYPATDYFDDLLSS